MIMNMTLKVASISYLITKLILDGGCECGFGCEYDYETGFGCGCEGRFVANMITKLLFFSGCICGFDCEYD